MNVVRLAIGYYPDPTIGKPVSEGYIYVGEPDLDPTVPANQKQISVLQEDTTTVAVAQPLRTSAGGVPIYDGSPVTILVDGDYSLAVLNKAEEQEYYVPNDDSTSSDVAISVDNIADLRLLPDGVPEEGMQASVAGYYVPGDGGGGMFHWDEDSVVTDDDGITIKVTAITTGRFVRNYSDEINVKWFGAKGDGATDDVANVQKAIDALPTAGPSKILFPPDNNYYLPSTCEFNHAGLTVQAQGAKFTSDADTVMIELNSGADVTSITTMNATLKREVRWTGGKFVNTAAAKTASVALNGLLFRQLIIEPEEIEGFWKGCNVAGRDTIRFNNGRYFDNVYSIYIPSDLLTDQSSTLGVVFDTVHFSKIITNFIVIRGTVSDIHIVRASLNFATIANNAVGILIDNVDAFETNANIFISGHWENPGTDCKGLYIKNSEPLWHTRNINIVNNHFNINNDNMIAVDLENCRYVKFDNDHFRQSSGATNSVPINFDDDCTVIDIGKSVSFSDKYPEYDTLTKRAEVTFAPVMRTENGAVPVTGFDGAAFTTDSTTLDMSTLIPSIYPAEANPIGYQIGVQIADSASAASDAPRIRFAQTAAILSASGNRSKLLSAALNPNDVKSGGSYYVPADENGDIATDYASSGALTLDIWITVDAIYM